VVALLPLVSALFLIDPISDMKGAPVELDPVRFAVGEKCYDVLIHEGHISQIEHHRLPRRLGDEQLSELLDLRGLHPATQGEYHFPVSRSLNPEHESS
jgi:hypothetical protein